MQNTCEHKAAPSVVIERKPSEHQTEDGRTLCFTHEWKCLCSECGASIDQGTTNCPEVIAAEYQVSGGKNAA
ncbi:MAG: hypothetical protein ACM3YO_05490 [Bacteroidota bacterium]